MTSVETSASILPERQTTEAPKQTPPESSFASTKAALVMAGITDASLPAKKPMPTLEQSMESISLPGNPATPTAEATEQSPPPYSPLKEVFIAVMGQTGTGKTSFISNATGQSLKVGHDLESCTNDVEVFETSMDGRTVKFIDTPGFDDSRRCDTDILQAIGYYLERAYAADIRLTGVIYLQRITDNRMPGSAVRSLRLLKKLCGPENFGNVVLVTTMWDEISAEKGEKREAELRVGDNWWKGLIMKGATIRRHHRTKESADDIVRHLLKKTPVVLQFQRELAAQHGIMAKTAAGEELIMYLAKMKEEYEGKIKKLQDEIKALQEDQRAKELKERQEAVEERKRQEEEIAKEIRERQKAIEERTKLEEEMVREMKEAKEERKKLEEQMAKELKEATEERKRQEQKMAEQLKQATAERKRLESETAQELQERREERNELEGEIKLLRDLRDDTEEDIQKLNKSLLGTMGELAERLRNEQEKRSTQGKWLSCPVQ